MNKTPITKRTIFSVFCFAVFLTTLSSKTIANGNSANTKPVSGQITKEVFDLTNTTYQRPVKVDLWRIKNTCLSTVNPQPCERTTTAKTKIAILSHGAMGAAIDYSWLAYPLAASGWTVIGMNHFGESWRYGRANIDPSTVTRFWQRTEDVTFILDSLSVLLPDAKISDHTEIVIIGHSSGGQTAAALAGVTLSMQQMINYCGSEKSSADLGCGYAKKGVNSAQALGVKLDSESHDDRISSVIMLDPALGPAATINSLNQVNKPTLVIGSLNNDFIPFEHHAKYYATHIPSAQLMTLSNNEGHFVYLNQCEHQHKAKGVPLCQDRPGVDRKQVHRKLVGRILSFLNRI